MRRFYVFLLLPALTILFSACRTGEETGVLSADRLALAHAVCDPRGTGFDDALKHCADVNFTDAEGMTPLEHAIRISDAAKIRALLKRGADCSFRDGKQYTALHFAASMIDSEPLKILLESGADPATRGYLGKTPLMEAARLGCIDNVRLLLKHGADIEARDDEGRTTLMFAASANTHSLNMVKLLLSAGAKPGLYDKHGVTPLFRAIDSGKRETALHLLSLFPDFDKQSAASMLGFMAMKHAVFAGDAIIAERIIAKKLPLNSDLSLAYKSLGLVNMEGLFELMARNGVVADGKTPLFWAAEADKPDIVKLLLLHGADPEQRDNAGRRPKSYARQYATIRAFDDADSDKDSERD